MSPAPPRRTVAIVGGGVAGLTLAATLDPERFAVTIYEAAPERSAYGGALAMWPAARRALGRIGLREAVDAVATPAGGGAIRDLSGRPMISAHPPGLVMVPRGQLLAAVDAAVPPSVRRVRQEVTHPRLLTEEVVVGADGVRSRVRPLVHPKGEAAAERRASPFVALRGVVDGVPDEDEVGEYWGPGLLFGLVPAGGRTSFFTAHRSELGPEPLDVQQVLAEARDRFAGSAPVIDRTLAGGDRQASAVRLWTTPPMRRYTRGRYVVVGDAAHAMLPNLGRGACEAVVDAVTLAEALTRGDLGLWEARRVPPTQVMRVGAGMLMGVATSRVLGGMPPAPLAALSRVRPRRRADLG